MVIIQPTFEGRAKRAPINKILPFTCVDGPGSRMIIFFQGCNMACPSCHNPQTIGQCDDCLDCLNACPYQALSAVQERLLCREDQCQRCDSCLPACTKSASPYAQWYSVEQLINKIKAQAMLLDGITVSGGEATLHHAFLFELFTQLKQTPECQHLTILIDSNGLLQAPHWTKLLPLIDGVMLDIKAMSADLHKQLTGRNNRHVLTSAQLLAQANKLLEVRYLVIEGKNDHQTELQLLADFLKALPQQISLRLNAFRHHGVIGEALTWTTTAETTVDQVADFFIAQGLTLTRSDQY